MQYKFRATLSFLKETKRLGKRYRSLYDDIENLRNEILANPAIGTDLGDGLRKIRMQVTSKGKGKSGGARVITFTVIASVDETNVYLLFIYDKSERSNITKTELKNLMKDEHLL